MAKRKKYDEKSVSTLSWDEHIRKRPGMYLGTVNSRGFVNLLKELITGCILNRPHAEVRLNLHDRNTGDLTIASKTITVPPFWIESYLSGYTPIEFGLMALAALSSAFKLHLLDEANIPVHTFNFKNGKVELNKSLEVASTFSGIRVNFSLDEGTWGGRFKLDPDFISQQLREYAYLNANAKFEILYKKGGEDCRVIHQFPDGLQSYIEYLALDRMGAATLPTTFTYTTESFTVEAAFAFNEYSVEQPIFKSFANNVYTFWDGTHVDGLFMGLSRALKRYIEEQELTGKYDVSEENLRNGLIGAISIGHEAPTFAGATKSKLSNEDVVLPISEQVAHHFYDSLIKDEKAAKGFFQYHLRKI